MSPARNIRHSSPWNRPLLLLQATPATFAQPASYSSHTFRRSVYVEVRGRYLLVFRRGDSRPSKTILLRQGILIATVDKSSAVVQKGHTFTFSTVALRDAFFKAVQAATRQSVCLPEEYCSLSLVGRGANGRVYQARSPDGNGLAALKTVPKIKAFERPEATTRFLSEHALLTAAAAAKSPYIVRLYSAFETRDSFCFSTEMAAYADLRTLQSQLPSRRFTEHIAKALFMEITIALQEVHRLGFLHRDVKPSNVLLNEKGHVRLADFGCSKRVLRRQRKPSTSSDSDSDEECDRPVLGRSHSFVGTRRFVAPERLPNSKKGHGVAADMWALGMTLYVLLTGDYPFGRETPVKELPELHHAIAKKEFEYPSYLSADVISLLRGLLERDESKRFSFAQVRKHPWLADGDWAAVLERADSSMPQEDVINYLNGFGIEKASSGMRYDRGGGELFQVVAEVGSGIIEQKRKGKTDMLGFEFSDQMHVGNRIWNAGR